MNKPQLFLLHFAGGNYYSFQFMLPYLKELNVIPIELPGRGKRIKEPLLTDFNNAAEDIYTQIKSKLISSEYLIYGHSMGATLGLRVSHMLEKNNTPPKYLIVSGNSGPKIRDENYVKKYLLNHSDFIEELRKLGGVPNEILENNDLLNFFEPILRADFETLEKEKLDNEPIINSPIFAMMGHEEKSVNDITNWNNYTTNKFDYRVLNGNHFFIYKHPNIIAQIIKKCYDNSIIL